MKYIYYSIINKTSSKNIVIHFNQFFLVIFLSKKEIYAKLQKVINVNKNPYFSEIG
jgi:hypothetical protein